MMMWHCGSGGWAHWVWMAGTVALWALLIFAVVLVVRHLVSLDGARASANGRPSREEGLIGERFARGEIDDDEYRRRITVLREHR